MTYAIISIPFMIAALALWAGRRHRYPRQVTITALVLAVLVGLTVIFDNLMVAAGFVIYDDANNLGIFIGRIPVEDVLYSIFVALVVTALWPRQRP